MAILFFAFLAISPPKSGAQDGDGFQEKLLVRAIQGPKIREVAFGSAGKSVAYTVLDLTDSFVAREDGNSTRFESASSPVLSSDGAHLAYVVLGNKEHFVCLDGSREGPYTMGIGIPPSISPKGDRIAYTAVVSQQPAKSCVVIGGKRSEAEYDSASNPIFSSDGQHTAYTAEKDKKWFVVQDGVNGPLFDLIHQLEFTKDGKTLAYIARNGKKDIIQTTHGSVDVLGPGAALGPFVKEFRLADDGSVLSYIVENLDGSPKMTLYVRGKRVVSGDQIRSTLLKGSSEIGAYIVRENGWDVMVVSGTREPKHYEEIHDPVLSPDGKQVAYWAVDGDDTFIVCGANKSEAYDVCWFSVIWTTSG